MIHFHSASNAELTRGRSKSIAACNTVRWHSHANLSKTNLDFGDDLVEVIQRRPMARQCLYRLRLRTLARSEHAQAHIEITTRRRSLALIVYMHAQTLVNTAFTPAGML
jgi:hypothetical protein